MLNGKHLAFHFTFMHFAVKAKIFGHGIWVSTEHYI